jgi:hypothetical protein
MAGTRGYGPGNFLLNLDGAACGFVTSAGGGDAVGEVVEERSRTELFTKKSIGAVRYDAIELSIGFDMTHSIYDWIKGTWERNYSREDGSIVVTDSSFQAVSERQFHGALITEVTIPALDASSKDAVYLTLKVAPTFTHDVKPSGKVTPPKTPAQKQFIASSFSLELGDLPCSRVSKIESFTVKQPMVTEPIGTIHDQPPEPGPLEFPNLRVTIAAADAGPWTDWQEDFIVKGNHDDSHEQSGAVVFLSPNRNDELARIDLSNVGIFALRRQGSHVVADLYCERMQLHTGKPVPLP